MRNKSIFLSGLVAVATSAALSLAALFVVGAFITILTDQNPVRSGLRQLLFGLAAASITFGLGKVLGISLAG